MPTVNIPILRAWEMRSQPEYIQFAVRRFDGTTRRMRIHEDTALGEVLREALDAEGYEGPR